MSGLAMTPAEMHTRGKTIDIPAFTHVGFLLLLTAWTELPLHPLLLQHLKFRPPLALCI